MSDKIETVGAPYLIQCDVCRGAGIYQHGEQGGADCARCDGLGDIFVVRVKRDTAALRVKRERETYVAMRSYVLNRGRDHRRRVRNRAIRDYAESVEDEGITGDH